MHIVRKSSFTATRWKNGGGITHEVFRVPPGDAAFCWRLSVAQIDVSGPFSDFAGYDRKMVLLRGAGLRLSFDAAPPVSLLQVGDMVQFDGALKTDCQLVAGSCTDLNLMTARSTGVMARVERLPGPQRLRVPARCVMLVFGIVGGLELGGVAAGRDAVSVERLDEWDLAVLPAGATATVTPEAGQGASSLVFFATLDDNPA